MEGRRGDLSSFFCHSEGIPIASGRPKNLSGVMGEILRYAQNGIVFDFRLLPSPSGEEGWAGIQRGFTPAGIWGTGEGEGQGEGENKLNVEV